MKKYTAMKTENQSNSNKKKLNRIGLNLILKSNQFDEQITKLKKFDRMIFPFKTEPNQSVNTLIIYN